MKIIIAISILLLTAGCATQADRQALAEMHYKAQDDFVKTASALRKPIFEMRGKEGETIELKGVQSLTVWGGENSAQATFQAAPVQKSEVVEALGVVKDTALGLAPYALGVSAIRGFESMGGSIERAGISGHGAVTTTTTNNANQANTTTTSTLGNQSVMGSGSVSIPATTTSTTTSTTSSNNPLTCTTGPC